jgi:hypothetical protein
MKLITIVLMTIFLAACQEDYKTPQGSSKKCVDGFFYTTTFYSGSGVYVPMLNYICTKYDEPVKEGTNNHE